MEGNAPDVLPDYLFGRHENTEAVDQFVASNHNAIFASAAAPLQDSGKGKVVLLQEAVKQVVGKYLIHQQTIGDCVSHGFGLGVDVLRCVQIALKGEMEKWMGEVATEIIYGGSRVEIGGGRLGNQDGSSGGWAAQWLMKYGVLLRAVYGQYDLTRYSGNTAKSFGRSGVPDELEPKAREFPVRTCSLVTSYEQARDAIANGYPVAVCSNRGFNSARDSDGFLRPQGSWPHCMLFSGVNDQSRRPGLQCDNSWGSDWVTGPTGELPLRPGSFWVDADVCDKMLRQQDSYSLSGVVGYPALLSDLFTY